MGSKEAYLRGFCKRSIKERSRWILRGEEAAIDELKAILEDREVFRKEALCNATVDYIRI